MPGGERAGRNAKGVPEQIGRYEVIEPIGSGAMAEIYRARDPEIDRVVAVKVLKAALNDEEDLERFMREARAAGALTHPNIVTIFDVGRVDESPYITMELLEGQTLEDLMLSGEQLSDVRILELAIDLAGALEYAHARGVVHRDVKPSNILFMPGTGQPKIADFGIARFESADETSRTASGTVVGTPRYMSPEQALGLETDGRTDLFALGVILYEMLTGTKAFDAPTTTSLLLQITQSEPPSLKKSDRVIPTGLQRIISKLMAKNPAKRFQDGGELVAALARELENAREREADAARNKYVPLRLKWAASMGLTVALVLATSIYVVTNLQARQIRQQAVDSGTALAKFIATEAAVPVLGEDWIRLESFVAEAQARDTFEYLVVRDHQGVIRATTEQALDVESNPSSELVFRSDEVIVTALELPGTDEEAGMQVYDFAIDILFQQTRVGDIHLGLSTVALHEVMDATRNLMLVLGVVTLIAVVAMLYVFGSLLTRPLRLLAMSMQTFSKGDWDHRTSSVRNDEIGHLFSAFNKMADRVQARIDGVEDETLQIARNANLQNLPDEPDATMVIKPSELVDASGEESK